MQSSDSGEAFDDDSSDRPVEHVEQQSFGGLIQDLENELTQAQAELEQYQGLLNELPGIYEDKFRQKVRSVAEDIRHLLDERQALQEQVSRALVQSRQPEALPPAAASAPIAPPPPTKRWSDVRLPRFQSTSSDAVPPRRPPFKRWSLGRGLLGGRQMGVVLGSGVVLTLLVLGLPQLLSRRVVPAAGGPPLPGAGQRLSPPIPARLRLQARGGQSWVLVERLVGGKVLDTLLEPGQIKVLPLGAGLRIRSGRPDLLYLSVGTARPEPLGTVSDLDWVEIRP